METVFKKHGHRILLMILGTILYFFANIQRVAVPGSIFNPLQQELKVSAPYITAFGAAFMYVYALNQLLVGVAVNRYGGKRVIAAGSCFFCAGALIFPLSHTLELLYFSRILTGFGASVFYLSLVQEIREHCDPKNFTVALSVMILSGYAGGILANAPFIICSAYLGWRSLLLVTGIMSLTVFLLFLLIGRRVKDPPVKKEVRLAVSPFHEVLRKTNNRNIFLFSGINFGVYYVIQTVIGKKFLEDFCRMEAENAAWLLSLMGLFSAGAGFSFALISRLTGNRRRIFLRISGITGFLVFSGILAALLTGFRSSLLGIPLCLLSLTASTAAITVPLLHETNDGLHAGTSVSLLNFISYLAVALLGNAVGFLMNLSPPESGIDGIQIYGTASYLAVFSVLFFLSGAALRCAWNIRENPS